MASGHDDLTEIQDGWRNCVNMTATAPSDCVSPDESKCVGDKSSGSESTGHASSRRIVEIYRTRRGELWHLAPASFRRRMHQGPSGPSQHRRDPGAPERRPRRRVLVHYRVIGASSSGSALDRPTVGVVGERGDLLR